MSRSVSIALVASACVLPFAGAEAAILAPPVIEVFEVPAEAKVGDLVFVRAQLVPPIVDPPAPEPGIFSTVEVEVVKTPKAGKGKGRAESIFVCIDDHEHVDVDIPIRAAGWASGSISICIRATSFTPEDGPIVTEQHLVIPVVKGNGTQK